MKTLSLSEAKMKLSELVDKVRRLDEQIVITKNGRPAAVLVSPDQMDSYRETVAIQSNTDFMRDIDHGLKSLKKKKRKLYTLEELFED